jgi:hypothetical protein
MVFAALFLLGMAAWIGGSLIGFLFGVPRFQNESEQRIANSVYIPNTNLEQISDWLTKIIIGATLVEIKQISSAIGDLSIFIGSKIEFPGSDIMAGGVLVFYFVTGFTWGYLWCSLRIFREMADLARELSPA